MRWGMSQSISRELKAWLAVSNLQKMRAIVLELNCEVRSIAHIENEKVVQNFINNNVFYSDPKGVNIFMFSAIILVIGKSSHVDKTPGRTQFTNIYLYDLYDKAYMIYIGQ